MLSMQAYYSHIVTRILSSTPLKTTLITSPFYYTSFINKNSRLSSSLSSTMSDRQYPHQVQVHPASRYEGGVMRTLAPQKGPSTSQILAVVTLVPVGGILLGLAGLTLLGTLIGLAVATPVFILFSPVLVPAAITVALAVTGFLTSGAFGLTGLSSLSWIVNYFKQGRSMTEQLDYTKKRIQERAAEAAATVGQKTKETGQAIQSKAQETKESARTDVRT